MTHLTLPFLQMSNLLLILIQYLLQSNVTHGFFRFALYQIITFSYDQLNIYSHTAGRVGLHYYESIEYSEPDEALFQQLTDYIPNYKIAPIVSMDAVYRQTFYKENLWRLKGCVGVDMETSALYSVGSYLGLHVVSASMVSDRHPLSEADGTWEWGMTKELRRRMLWQVIDFALQL